MLLVVKHTWGRGGDEPSWGSKTNPFSCSIKMGTHHTKNSILYYIPPFLEQWATPFSMFRSCLPWRLVRILVHHSTKRPTKLTWRLNFFFFRCQNFFDSPPPPSPPLHPGYDSQKHHLPWRHFWPMYTQGKISSPLLWKKWCPCV